MGTTAQASLQGEDAKFRHGPLELAFHSRKSGFPLYPSIVVRNMATLLTADLHPSGDPEIWLESQISINLFSRIPIQKDEDGRPSSCIRDLDGTRVSRAKAAMRMRYPDGIGDRTIVREVLKILVRCMLRMGDVTK